MYVYGNLTLIVFYDVIFFSRKKISTDFLWVKPPFVDSFGNLDWLELVVFFHVQTNKMLNRMLSWSTSQTTGIYDYAFRQVCATFGIDKFQGEQQKAIDMFFEGNNVSVSLPTGHGNTSRAAQAPVVRRSSCVISVKGIM